MAAKDPELGRLEKVDLRDVWATEASDFTPWLAREENIALLGDTIGLELEVEAQEKNVGPFRADILCKDTAEGHWVLIENQLARTDHCHLGQLLTYAAGLRAVTIVWLAERFTDEHRATLDWLNEITGDEFNFFGLEVELWKIGASLAAPKFNVVSQPNDWSRTISTAARTASQGELSGTKQWQFEYWTAFRRLMEERGGAVKPTKPFPHHWQNFSIGRTYFHLTTIVNSRAKRIAVYLVLTGDDAKTHFKLLERQRREVERDIAATLEWCELPERKESHIRLSRSGCQASDRSSWPEQHAWLFEKLQSFHRVFSSRVKELEAEGLEEAEV